MRVKTCPDCQLATRDRVRSASRWRRGGEIARWVLPSATLVVLPKCPVCLAAYVALFSGVSLSFASAWYLHKALMVLCVGALLFLIARRLSHTIKP